MFTSFNNVIDEATLKEGLVHALVELNDILVHHAGPFATNAILGSKWRQHNDIDEFTKDGIKILRYAIVDNAPMARLAARLARNIGITVDSRCHDGTTTSMLTFCRLAQYVLANVDDSILTPQSRLAMTEGINESLNICKSKLNDIRITDEDIANRAKSFGIDTTMEDVRAAIAYHMAMVSSKGNHDLSYKISEVIRTTPAHIQGIFSKITMGVETEEKYILTKQDYDLKVFANLGDLNDYNYKLNSQFKSDEAVIFSTANELVSASLEAKWLRAFISQNPRQRVNLGEFGTEKGWESYHENRKNLIILSPLIQDTELMMDIKEFNIKNPHCKISYFNTQTPPRLKTSFYNTLHYIAGKPLFSNTMAKDPLTSLIGLDTPAQVILIGHTLEMRGLYTREDGEVFHDLYRHPEKMEEYTSFAKECEDLIAYASDNSTNRALDPDDVALLTSWYRCLTCQDIYDIKIGGSAHDQYSNQTVYEDAIGAALSALKEGVVLGGYSHLAHTLIHNGSGDSDSTIINEIGYLLGGIVEDAMRTSMCISDVWNPHDKWSYVYADKNKCLAGEEHVVYDSLDHDGMVYFLTREAGKTILFQSWAGYDEQLKRFTDILPRLANTTRLVDMRTDDVADLG